MVVIQNSVCDPLVDEQGLVNVLQQVLKGLSRDKSELLVRIVDKAEIQTLNKTYRQQDKPTNVLSFNSNLPIEIDEDILGDLVICAEVVLDEATTQHKTFKQHLTHMAVHGTLHLLGFDHVGSKNADEMESLEIKILQNIGISNPYE